MTGLSCSDHCLIWVCPQSCYKLSHFAPSWSSAASWVVSRQLSLKFFSSKCFGLKWARNGCHHCCSCCGCLLERTVNSRSPGRWQGHFCISFSQSRCFEHWFDTPLAVSFCCFSRTYRLGRCPLFWALQYPSHRLCPRRFNQLAHRIAFLSVCSFIDAYSARNLARAKWSSHWSNLGLHSHLRLFSALPMRYLNFFLIYVGQYEHSNDHLSDCLHFLQTCFA